jgi:hypothetical protein
MVAKALAMAMTFARHEKYFNKRVLCLLYLKKENAF